ncbi:MAG: hypothetical protein AVDCRST_MAG08-4349, partial [uncultured Acetobacteraceae bacterium]
VGVWGCSRRHRQTPSFEGENLAFRHRRARHGPLAAPEEPAGACGRQGGRM